MIGFIYKWVDITNNLAYIGRHSGSLDDGYVSSGTIFINEYNSRPSDFIREILWISEDTNSIEICFKEDEFLKDISIDEFYYGKNRKYYNIVNNSAGYTSEDNPMRYPEIAKKMVQTQKKNGKLSPFQNSVNKYGYEEACRLAGTGDASKGGKAQKGIPKSLEHRRKISESLKGKKYKKLMKEINNGIACE